MILKILHRCYGSLTYSGWKIWVDENAWHNFGLGCYTLRLTDSGGIIRVDENAWHDVWLGCYTLRDYKDKSKKYYFKIGFTITYCVTKNSAQ